MSLFEVLVVSTVALGSALIVYPAVHKSVSVARRDGLQHGMVSLLQIARRQAILKGVPAVVEFDLEKDEMVSFLNYGDGGDPFSFDDEASGTGTPDFLLNQFRLPESLAVLKGPEDVLPGQITTSCSNGSGAICEFTKLSSHEVPKVIFQPDGSVRDPGGIRIGDQDGNRYFEILVSPKATARTRVREWNTEGGTWQVVD